MRKEFIPANSYRQAYRVAPWAVRVMKVVGGFIAFASDEDYFIAKNQK